MPEPADTPNANPGSEAENLRVRIAALNSEVEAADLKSAALADTQNALRTAIKAMGWRVRDCAYETARDRHNACIRDLLAILDGQTALVGRYVNKNKEAK